MALFKLPPGQVTHLEKPLQPPNLEDTLPNHHGQLENTPPLDTAIGALCRIPVHTLPNHDIRLFVPNLGKSLGETAD